MPDISSILPAPFAWCDIPAGDVMLTDVGGYVKASTARFVPAFRVSHNLVTPAQYAVFMIHSMGYVNLDWWAFSDEAMQWRTQNTEPTLDLERAYMNNVAWYDAIAFCRWVSALTGKMVTLPTDQQWEQLANAENDDLGCYAWGVYDDSLMTYQNVISEWCLNMYETGTVDLGGDDERLIRLGYWHYSEEAGFRVRMRVKGSPTMRHSGIGFRLVYP